MILTNRKSIVDNDSWLKPYSKSIDHRVNHFKYHSNDFFSDNSFTQQHKVLGIHYFSDKDYWIYREWAPEATALHLMGDFNKWNKTSHPLTRDKNGIWFIKLVGKKSLLIDSLIKVVVTSNKGVYDRIPTYIQRVVQNTETNDFAGQIVLNNEFKWHNYKTNIEAPTIYEAHIGMGQEKEGVGTYNEFTENILPRIRENGYNTIQLMAIQEHPYYGSFGYHVSNFFAPSSRFGTIEDLKRLVNEAHKLGINVIMDLVHSHAVKNIAEGLNEFDGTEYQFFHEGGRGNHNAWDSKLFNYGKREVVQFLLSNIRYWMEEFNMDGFRFDGITSMLYIHHGDHMQFDHYDKYFDEGVDQDALLYLQLANELIHKINPNAISIAEDYSGMPGLCREQELGGLGFDYRLGMGIPDFWIKYLKEKRDEDWNMNELFNTLLNRRYKEKTIAYAESHDQAIVGDKTIAFRLMDKEMYFHMKKNDSNPIIDRGMALHKMIRLLTLSIGGEGYLNFIGNEFGHPEWVDFPRQGNNWSYKYAKRQWSLVDNDELKFKYLLAFDKAMLALNKKYKLLNFQETHLLNVDEINKVLIFKKSSLIFVFNFNPSKSIFDYQFYVPENKDYQLILSSDAPEFGGFDRLDSSTIYSSTKNKLSIYCVNRSVLVFGTKS